MLHLPAALEGCVHGEYVLVGGVHGGNDGEIGGKFDWFIWLIIKRHGNISIIDGIFAFTIVISVQKLEDFAKDCRCVATVKLFDNEQALLIRLCIRSFENLGKGTKNKFVLQLFLCYALCVFYFFENGQQLAYMVDSFLSKDSPVNLLGMCFICQRRWKAVSMVNTFWSEVFMVATMVRLEGSSIGLFGSS